MKHLFSPQLATVAAVTVLAAAAAQAQVATEYPYSQDNGFSAPVSADDILTGATITTTGTLTNNFNEGTSNPSVLTNGIFSIRESDGLNQLFTPSEGATVTFTLAAPAFVTQISTYGGWQDSGRDRQNLVIEYAVAGALSAFLPVATVNFEPTNTDGGISASRVDTFTSLANVGAIRFTFPAQENGFAGYGEFDVIPEPSSAMLLGAGVLGLISRRRRA